MAIFRCKYLLFCSFFVFAFTGKTQNKVVDSLLRELTSHASDTLGVQILNDLEYEYENTDFTQARKYINQAERLATKLNWDKGLAITYGNKCWMYKNNFQLDSTLYYQKKLEALGKKRGNHDWLNTAYTILGSIRHAQNDFDASIAAYKNAVEEGRKSGKPESMAIAYNNVGNVYEDKGNYDSAIICFNKALDIRVKANNKQGQLDTWSNIAVAYVRKGKYDKAIEIFLNNAIEYDKLGNVIQVAQCYANASVVYDQMDNKQKALDYSIKALDIYKKTTNVYQIAMLTNNVGVHYEHLDKPDLALKYYRESKNLYEKINSEKGIATQLNNIGSILQIKGKHREALDNFKQALAIKQKMNEVNTIPLTYHNIATAYLNLNNIDSTLAYLQQSEKLAMQLHFLPDLQNAYRTYCDAYEKKGDFGQALKYYKLYHQYSDSLIDTEKAKRVTELEAIFENNKKELENKRLIIKNQQEKIARIEAEEKSNRRTKQLYIALSIGILIIGASWIIYQYRRRKLRDRFNQMLLNEKEEGIKAIFIATEEERKRIAKDLHDGVGQQMGGLKLAWQSISSDIHQTNPEQFARLINLTAVLDETAREVRNISHRMMPKVLTEMGLKDAIDDMLKKTLEHTSIQYDFESYGINDKRFDEKVEISLYRICQELVNNVIKHSLANKMSVQLIYKNAHLVLMVEDNGRGFDSQEKSGGIGLMNISSRVNTVNGKINYEASEGAGTVATVRIPINPV